MTNSLLCEKCGKMKPAIGFTVGFNNPIDQMEPPVEEKVCADCSKGEMELVP